MQKKRERKRKGKEANHGQVDEYLWSLYTYAKTILCLGNLCFIFSKQKF